MKPNKRNPSILPEKPDAKRVKNKTTSPRQAIPEQMDVDNPIPIVQYNTTVEDGNCFFHAVFGAKGHKDHKNEYFAKNADKMRTEWHKFLNQFSTNTNDPSKTGLNHPDMPSHLKEQLKAILNKSNDNTNPKERYSKYLDDIKKIGHWILPEEIPLLASLNNITIIECLRMRNSIALPIVHRPNIDLLTKKYTDTAKYKSKITKEIIIYLESLDNSNQVQGATGGHFSHAEVSNGNIENLINLANTGDTVSVNNQDQMGYSTTTLPSKLPHGSDAKETVSIEDLKEFFSQLFGREVSSNKYPSIKIDDQEDAYQVKVQRPAIVGESIEQMRDITSVMFIKTALANRIKDTSVGKDYLINNFIEYILAISKQIDGIELNKAQYQEYKKQKTPENGLFKLKFTKQEDNTRVVKYLMDNSDEYSEISDFDEAAAKVSHTEYLQKYIKGVLNGLRIMLNNDDTVKTAGKFITKFITSLIDPEEKLFEKDSILFKEVRLYKLAKEAKDADYTKYEILHNQDVITKIDNDRFGTGKFPFIRIIDKKGEIIKQAVKALNIIDLLVGNLQGHLIDDKAMLDLFKEYNENYNFHMKKLISGEHRRDLDNYAEYRTKFLQDEDTKEYNISDIFQYHVAKQLYSICDFRSLGTQGKMLVPAQKGDADEDILKVYTSATGQTIEQYSRQDQPDIEPMTLGKKAIAFVSFMLSPFASLRSHVPLEEKEASSPLQKISKAFFNLLKTDYPDDLDQQWSETLEQQFDADIVNNLTSLTSDLLGDNVQYDLEF